MGYAVGNNGKSWRAVNFGTKLADGEVYSEIIPEMPEPTIDERVTELWELVNGLVTKERNAAGFDNNGSLRALGWKSDPDCPSWRLERIRAVEAWGDVAWQSYYALKALLLAGQEITLPETLEACPYRFADLLME